MIFIEVNKTILGGWQSYFNPTSFSPVGSANVGFSSQKFQTFSFNPFATLIKSFEFKLSASPKLLNLKQEKKKKNCFFWSNSNEIEIMISSLIEILDLPNFGHMTTFII